MITKVGATAIQPRHRASCHCGSVVLEVDLPDGLVEPKRCNCSLCRRKGTIIALVPVPALRVVEGQDALTCYQFNTRVAKHYFCSKCGVHTHHQLRSNPQMYGVNVGCLDGVDPFQLDDVSVYDGVHHPLDR
jgi:hypothetical protein